MSKALITVGIASSGKTTWAKEQVENSARQQDRIIILSRDDFRRKILENKFGRELNPGELWSNWKFKDEYQVNNLIDAELAICLNYKLDIIIADTNLNVDRNQSLKQKLEKLGYEVEFKEFPISFEDACKRDQGRADGVGVNVLWKQWLQWLQYKGEPKASFCGDKSVIFDVDGTLAEMHNRTAFEWCKVGNDKPHHEIVDMLIGYKQMGYKILVVSGRDGICQKETEEWFRKIGIEYDHLFMRGVNDNRKDSIVKKEIYFKYIDGKFNVRLVVDDRPQVCRAWRELGLKVAQVADPYVEF